QAVGLSSIEQGTCNGGQRFQIRRGAERSKGRLQRLVRPAEADKRCREVAESAIKPLRRSPIEGCKGKLIVAQRQSSAAKTIEKLRVRLIFGDGRSQPIDDFGHLVVRQQRLREVKLEVGTIRCSSDGLPQEGQKAGDRRRFGSSNGLP